jgi:hypothetical protein
VQQSAFVTGFYERTIRKKDRHKAALVLVKYLNTRQGNKAIVYDNFSD